MPMTISEKILARASGHKVVKAGDIVWAKPDVAMMHDLLGPFLIADDLEELGGVICHPERVVVIADHSTPPATVEQANLVKLNREWSKKKGIENFYQFQGACHQLLVDYNFSQPGKLIVGTDSHTCTAGALGAFGTGIGSTEMLGVLVTGEIWLRVPDTIKIVWEGNFSKGVMAKDAILYTTGSIGHSGATYLALEFSGGLIQRLSIDERLVFTNMAVEMGAKTGIIAADEQVLNYYSDRGISVELLDSDPNAKYLRCYSFDASSLEPQVALPHQVDNVHPIREAEGMKIDQAYIGSCTGGRLNDLIAAASILKGRKVSAETRCIVVPASQEVWAKAASEGILSQLAEAGCIISAPACGACAGLTSGVVADGERCISSTNRNFVGRMGSKNAEVLLASPLTVAASALRGKVTDPRTII